MDELSLTFCPSGGGLMAGSGGAQHRRHDDILRLEKPEMALE
jgi:hypothetical protein